MGEQPCAYVITCCCYLDNIKYLLNVNCAIYFRFFKVPRFDGIRDLLPMRLWCWSALCCYESDVPTHWASGKKEKVSALSISIKSIIDHLQEPQVAIETVFKITCDEASTGAAGYFDYGLFTLVKNWSCISFSTQEGTHWL